MGKLEQSDKLMLIHRIESVRALCHKMNINEAKIILCNSNKLKKLIEEADSENR